MEVNDMLLNDKLIPMVIGARDRKSNRQYSDNLIRQAITYRNTLDSSYKKREQELIDSKLSPLRKAIAPLEVDHDRFLRAVEDKKREILLYPGVSDDDKLYLTQCASNAEYTLKTSSGVVITLNIDNILKKKDAICIEANRIIDSQNERFKKLHATFRYRLSNYLRALNNNGWGSNEIRVDMAERPTVQKHWNGAKVYSRATELEYENAKKKSDFMVRLDAS
jgi:hypothetical protein